SDVVSTQVQVLVSCNPARDPNCEPGTFSQPIGLAVGRTLRGITILDSNSDRKADIAVVDFSAAVVYTIAGNGDGTFHTPVPPDVARRAPIAVAAGNFADKNAPDIVTANWPANSISTLFNQGGDRRLIACPNGADC